ncbi:ATP-dependent DNA helicase RecG [Peptoniphilus lacrimalis]|uniref:ATP-dependent DNA helicase RecG n=1 Tax=Peptoniphilus lacrimalis TaxID=33031 RepID=UPI002550827F|nr:ATP-dependent DNA helicase RecG [Peptoniphilus lacrimalis]MDK7722050.1 ATP-dependent DNA helicase RecG [Peptoniphilus lacrimalis]MDK7731704.1 ATP-dependent DNA helicase RecG [Peptoniphilus lacrimalis]
MNIDDNIKNLKSVGPKRLKLLNNIGIFSIKDLLYFYPRRYEDSSKILKLSEGIIGEKATFRCRILSLLDNRNIRRGLSITSFLIEDDSAEAKLIFFNNRFIKNTIDFGETYLIYGKYERFRGRIQLTSPEIEKVDNIRNLGRIRGIYNQTKGLTNNNIDYLIDQVIDKNLFEECIPNDLIKKYSLIDKNRAIKNIHRPENRKSYALSKQRLVYEELLFFELSILSMQNKNNSSHGIKFNIPNKIYEFINNLPYKLTSGQEKVLKDITGDMQNGKSVNRLIQGDVGSGKTIVSIILSLVAVLNGYQCAIMAPTEILAKQHFENFNSLLEAYGVRIKLLVGSTSSKVKKEILTNTANGMIDILIGTHSLIEDDVKFFNLGLNVIDEQHRFGVIQRSKLRYKNDKACNIIMSATPIPRTLSLILYADLDISIIDTMPGGRKNIKTLAINSSQVNEALTFIEKELNAGHQAYVICSLIEDNEDFENLESVEKVFKDLKKFFKNYKLALLHGRLSTDEKNKVMEDFKNRKIDLIVSTTVIEVGINVANATVMMIYNAERFGLSTLHQLRGRVGRGDAQSYCILFNNSKSEISWRRMKIMTDSTDGFYIANKDLELRGFGDILGVRQSGIPNLRLANPLKDQKILSYASTDAKNILKEDIDLTGKYKNLKIFVDEFQENM